jgi:hypothetical protein
MLAEWLRRPHVAEWWTDCQTLVEVREQYLPILTDDSTVLPYIAYQESLPVGYIQSYVAAGAGMAGGRMNTIRECGALISFWRTQTAWAVGWAHRWSANSFSFCSRIPR